MRTKRRLALSVLLAAVALAAGAFPFRATWWGGFILAIAEAGIVGGLADWFAVTALFRRPLGLPIPHTALIPANWQLLAQRVGTMVGDRVLTREYLVLEIDRMDLAEWVARGAERVTRADLEAATRTLLGWAAREAPVASAGELVGRLQRLLVAQPVARTLATALELGRQHGWDRRVIGALARALADALERPELRRTVGELVDEVLVRYRERVSFYPRLALGLAGLLGLIDRERIVAALHSGLTEVANDAAHPLRERLSDAVAEFAGRLRRDVVLAGRVEAVKEELLGSPVVARLVDDGARALRRALLVDLQRPASEAVAWVADRLERWHRVVVTDAALRGQVERWIKTRATELVERHHGRIAAFIEKGVHALGPEGAVRLIEEHAGDDLQYIRVNGTVVGGLAGGLLYAIHLLVRLL
ncbi:MAG: hypothetical protein AUH29_09270 [Candidatus Rokubacteria bacterium 13_1_40CM_69_27]|nr:MAG: hypothetical protein AUH29_09270 [Candidatus Rokubacteria bacterium 13_1_40CM_69_27]